MIFLEGGCLSCSLVPLLSRGLTTCAHPWNQIPEKSGFLWAPQIKFCPSCPLTGLYIWPITFNVKINKRKSSLCSTELETRTMRRNKITNLVECGSEFKMSPMFSPSPILCLLLPLSQGWWLPLRKPSWIVSSVRAENVSYQWIRHTSPPHPSPHTWQHLVHFLLNKRRNWLLNEWLLNDSVTDLTFQNWNSE